MFMKILLLIFLSVIVVFTLGAVILRRLFYHLGLNWIVDLFGGQLGNRGFSRQTSSEDQTRKHKRQTKTPSGDIIIDHRTTDKVNQKIFHKNEGEYVHFEEK